MPESVGELYYEVRAKILLDDQSLQAAARQIEQRLAQIAKLTLKVDLSDFERAIRQVEQRIAQIKSIPVAASSAAAPTGAVAVTSGAISSGPRIMSSGSFAGGFGMSGGQLTGSQSAVVSMLQNVVANSTPGSETYTKAQAQIDSITGGSEGGITGGMAGPTVIPAPYPPGSARAVPSGTRAMMREAAQSSSWRARMMMGTYNMEQRQQAADLRETARDQMQFTRFIRNRDSTYKKLAAQGIGTPEEWSQTSEAVASGEAMLLGGMRGGGTGGMGAGSIAAGSAGGTPSWFLGGHPNMLRFSAYRMLYGSLPGIIGLAGLSVASGIARAGNAYNIGMAGATTNAGVMQAGVAAHEGLWNSIPILGGMLSQFDVGLQRDKVAAAAEVSRQAFIQQAISSSGSLFGSRYAARASGLYADPLEQAKVAAQGQLSSSWSSINKQLAALDNQRQAMPANQYDRERAGLEEERTHAQTAYVNTVAAAQYQNTLQTRQLQAQIAGQQAFVSGNGSLSAVIQARSDYSHSILRFNEASGKTKVAQYQDELRSANDALSKVNKYDTSMVETRGTSSNASAEPTINQRLQAAQDRVTKAQNDLRDAQNLANSQDAQNAKKEMQSAGLNYQKTSMEYGQNVQDIFMSAGVSFNQASGNFFGARRQAIMNSYRQAARGGGMSRMIGLGFNAFSQMANEFREENITSQGLSGDIAGLNAEIGGDPLAAADARLKSSYLIQKSQIDKSLWPQLDARTRAQRALIQRQRWHRETSVWNTAGGYDRSADRYKDRSQGFEATSEIEAISSDAQSRVEAINTGDAELDDHLKFAILREAGAHAGYMARRMSLPGRPEQTSLLVHNPWADYTSQMGLNPNDTAKAVNMAKNMANGTSNERVAAEARLRKAQAEDKRLKWLIKNHPNDKHLANYEAIVTGSELSMAQYQLDHAPKFGSNFHTMGESLRNATNGTQQSDPGYKGIEQAISDGIRDGIKAGGDYLKKLMDSSSRNKATTSN